MAKKWLDSIGKQNRETKKNRFKGALQTYIHTNRVNDKKQQTPSRRGVNKPVGDQTPRLCHMSLPWQQRFGPAQSCKPPNQPPAAGRKKFPAKPPMILLSRSQPAGEKIRLSRRFSAGLADRRSHNHRINVISASFFPQLNCHWNIIICGAVWESTVQAVTCFSEIIANISVLILTRSSV